MGWTLADYDCRNYFINVMNAGTENVIEDIFDSLDEWLEIKEEFSPEILVIVGKIKKINREKSQKEIFTELQKINELFLALDM